MYAPASSVDMRAALNPCAVSQSGGKEEERNRKGRGKEEERKFFGCVTFFTSECLWLLLCVVFFSCVCVCVLLGMGSRLLRHILLYVHMYMYIELL